MASAADRGTFRLSMADEDATVRIVSIAGGAGLARRVAAMGLNIGCELRVVQRQQSGLVVARGETRFALGGAIAHGILVCAV